MAIGMGVAFVAETIDSQSRKGFSR